MDVGRELYPLTAIVRILLAQMGLGLIVVGAGFGVSGGVAAWSALLGSLVCVLPNAFLGARIVLAGGGGDARKLLRASYVGAAGKLLLTAAGFAVVFALVRNAGARLVFWRVHVEPGSNLGLADFGEECGHIGRGRYLPYFGNGLTDRKDGGRSAHIR